MGVKTSTLAIVIRAKDLASRVLKRTGAGIGTFTTKAAASINRLKKSVLSLKGAFLGLIGVAVMGRVAKSFIKAASTIEDTRVAMELLLGSTEETAKLMKNLNTFASKVPFTFEEIARSAASLSGVFEGGRKEVEAFMPLIADLAAFGRTRGIDFDQTTQQIVRMFSAGAASADLFREKGITAMLGFQMGVKISAEETKNRIIDAWQETGSKFRGLAEKMSQNWSGQISMMQDAWFQFRVAVMQSGVFEFMKKGLGATIELMKDMKEDAPELGRDILKTMKFLALFAAATADGFRLLKLVLVEVAAAINGMTRQILITIDGLVLVLAGFARFFDVEFSELIATQADKVSKAIKTLDENMKNLGAESKGMREAETNLTTMRNLITDMDRRMHSFTEGMTPLSDILGQYKTDLKESNVELAESKRRWEEMKKAAAATQQVIMTIGSTISSSIVGMLGSAIDGTLNWRDAIKGLLKDLSLAIARMLLLAGVKAIAGLASPGGGAGGVAAGAAGAASSAAGAGGGFAGVSGFFAKGGILPQAQKGMVVHGPTVIGDNRSGVEGALPLERDADGVLGVRSVGGGGGMTVNINAVDGESVARLFQNNGEALMAAWHRNMQENPSMGTA